jgi:ferritin-like metal-binding protein YciE
VKTKVVSLLAETNQQIARLDECLRSFGDSSSALKDTAQSFMGNMAAMAHTVAEDEILKNTFANKRSKTSKSTAYKSLLAMCDSAGAAACKSPLEANLREEETMAKWISENVTKVTQMFIGRQAQAAT